MAVWLASTSTFTSTYTSIVHRAAHVHCSLFIIHCPLSSVPPSCSIPALDNQQPPHPSLLTACLHSSSRITLLPPLPCPSHPNSSWQVHRPSHLAQSPLLHNLLDITNLKHHTALLRFAITVSSTSPRVHPSVSSTTTATLLVPPFTNRRYRETHCLCPFQFPCWVDRTTVLSPTTCPQPVNKCRHLPIITSSIGSPALAFHVLSCFRQTESCLHETRRSNISSWIQLMHSTGCGKVLSESCARIASDLSSLPQLFLHACPPPSQAGQPAGWPQATVLLRYY